MNVWILKKHSKHGTDLKDAKKVLEKGEEKV